MAFFCKRMRDLFPRAPVGEGGKGRAAGAVEALDGVEQAEGAFLDEIVIRQAEVAIAGSQATDEREVALDEKTRGSAIAMLRSFDKLFVGHRRRRCPTRPLSVCSAGWCRVDAPPLRLRFRDIVSRLTLIYIGELAYAASD